MQGYISYNVIMVFSRDGERLLMCRRRKPPYAGKSNLVGGKIEAAENGTDAAYRELFEETSIPRDAVDLVHVMDYTYHLSGVRLEVYAGQLNRDVTVSGDENELYWSVLGRDFFDIDLFAGEGNIGHMLEQVRLKGLVKPGLQQRAQGVHKMANVYENGAFSIRFATENDVDLLMRYIAELAEHEREAHCVTATAEDLRQTMFVRGVGQALIAQEGCTPVGYATFYQSFNTYQCRAGIHLNDLYIQPQARGKGYGKLLLAFLARLCQERGCGRLEWWVHDFNHQAAARYQKWGAAPLDDLRVYRLDGQAIPDLAKALGE